jgi:hypothetical protein
MRLAGRTFLCSRNVRPEKALVRRAHVEHPIPTSRMRRDARGRIWD